jgi:hypothetical protein
MRSGPLAVADQELLAARRGATRRTCCRMHDDGHRYALNARVMTIRLSRESATPRMTLPAATTSSIGHVPVDYDAGDGRSHSQPANEQSAHLIEQDGARAAA